MYDKVLESAEFIKTKVSIVPQVGIILGSGLGDLINSVENPKYISYCDIPNFPVSTIKGHEGRLVFGTIKGKQVMLMQGRFHYYEGYTMKEVTFPVFVMKLLGINKLIVTNACGGINKNLAQGDLMLITDFINLISTNPLFGVNDERFGTRFPDMSEPYKLEWIESAKKIADKLNIKYHEGVYGCFAGPCYETKAEIKAFERLGCDAVGMSTVPETIVANYLSMDVLGISCITNMATGIQKVKHSHDNVVATAKKAGENLCKWVENIVENIY